MGRRSRSDCHTQITKDAIYLAKREIRKCGCMAQAIEIANDIASSFRNNSKITDKILFQEIKYDESITKFINKRFADEISKRDKPINTSLWKTTK